MSQLMFQHTRVQHLQSQSHDNQSPLYISPILLPTDHNNMAIYFCIQMVMSWASFACSLHFTEPHTTPPFVAHCTSQNPTHTHTSFWCLLHFTEHDSTHNLILFTALHRTLQIHTYTSFWCLLHFTEPHTTPFPFLLTARHTTLHYPSLCCSLCSTQPHTTPSLCCSLHFTKPYTHTHTSFCCSLCSTQPHTTLPLLLTNFGNSCSFLNSKECS